MTNFTYRAEMFARKWHEGQTYDGLDYADAHLSKVAEIARKYSNLYYLDTDIVGAIGWLHDVLEDTKCTYDELLTKFDSTIADTVYAVTDEIGFSSRKLRKLHSYSKIRSSRLAVYIKLCDRLVNVSNGGKLDMYYKEHYAFKAALWEPNEYEFLWQEIEKKLKWMP